jgi:arylsulfatase A-like enzyme/Flp pilus assembly protein TadD
MLGTSKRFFSPAVPIAGIVLAVSLSLGSGTSPLLQLRSKDANVLLITIDTLRYDRIGFLSPGFVKTPFIDAFARRSVSFSRAYAHSPLTRPSHTNILTGTTPLYHGVSDNPGYRLEAKFLTLAEHLKAAKYRTGAFIGAFVLDSRFGLDQGFETYNDSHGQSDIVERRAEEVVTPAIAWIAGQKSKWFCWVHLFDPHDPYVPPEPFRTAYAEDPYSGEVAYVDAQLGRLFEALEKSGAMARTIVVLTSDHGESLGEKEELYHGFFAYNAVLHVPLLVSAPGLTPQSVSADASHVDIFPTICELAGLPVPVQIQGESLLPLIAGQTTRTRPAIYFESMSPHLFLDAAPLQGFIRSGRKFIDQPIKEVYDLAADPREDDNLASRSDLPLLVQELDGLRKRLTGPGTTPGLEGRDRDIEPLMRSLGYVAAKPAAKRAYGPPDDLKALQPLIAQLRQGVEQFRDGDPATALKKINNIIRIRPTYVTAYIALSTLYSNRELYDQSLAVLRDGLAKNPDSLPLMERLGIVLVMAKKYADAVGALEECARRDPSNPDYRNYLGRARMGLGDLDEAEEQFRLALAIDPEMVEPFNNLGYLYLMRFRRSPDPAFLDQALENFEKALAFNPKLSSALKGKEAALALRH